MEHYTLIVYNRHNKVCCILKLCWHWATHCGYHSGRSSTIWYTLS